MEKKGDQMTMALAGDCREGGASGRVKCGFGCGRQENDKGA